MNGSEMNITTTPSNGIRSSVGYIDVRNNTNLSLKYYIF